MYAVVSVDLRCAVNVSEFAKRDGPSQSEFALPRLFSLQSFLTASSEGSNSVKSPKMVKSFGLLGCILRCIVQDQ